MDIIKILQQEFHQESGITRKMLALVPQDKYDWKPHEKSMTMLQLATHIAEIPSWIGMGLHTEGIDFASFAYTPTPIANNDALLALFEKNVADGLLQLEGTTTAALNGTWIMRAGDHIIAEMSKYDTIRHAYSQIIHHRAQLGVYLRLLDIPIPGTYGPSADDQGGF